MLSLNQTIAVAVLGGVLFAPASPAVAVPPVPFPSPVIPVAPIRADDKDKTDAAELKKLGVAAVFQPGASLEAIVDFIRSSVKQTA